MKNTSFLSVQKQFLGLFVRANALRLVLDLVISMTFIVIGCRKEILNTPPLSI